MYMTVEYELRIRTYTQLTPGGRPMRRATETTATRARVAPGYGHALSRGHTAGMVNALEHRCARTEARLTD